MCHNYHVALSVYCSCMVIINTDPWQETSSVGEQTFKKEDKKQQEVHKEKALFGFQDLASDYYQVLRQKNRPRCCRIIWGVAVGFLFLATLFLVCNLVIAYFKYESYNKSSTEWKDNLTLPAITICSTNYINYTSLKNSLDAENETQVFELFNRAMDFLETFDGRSNFMESINIEQYYPIFEYERKTTSLILNFSLDVSELLRARGTPHYYFQHKGVYITDFWEAITMTELGLCLNINDDGALKQSHGGANDGFTIDLNTNLDHYLPTTSTDGFILFIRDHNEVLFLSHGGYVIAPGAETFVRLKSKSIKRLGPPHGTCKNVESRYSKSQHHFESVRECWERQEMEAMINKCGCIPVYFAETMLHNNRSNILDEAVQTIIKNANISSRNYDYSVRSKEANTMNGNESDGDITWDKSDKLSLMSTPYYEYACGLVLQVGCKVYVENMLSRGELKFEKCPEPCKYHEWDAVITSSPFPPTHAYFNKFIKTENVPTFEYARESVARLHVYYDEIKIQKAEQEKTYRIFNFIAEFGGTVDLFIGFSFFTILQLMEICIASCILRCRKREPTSEGPLSNEMLHRSLEKCSIKLSGLEV